MTDIKELMQTLKAAAVRAKIATEEYASGNMSVSVCYSECEEFNRLTDGPDQILPLIEALEAKDARIAELQSRAEAADKLQDSAFRDGLKAGFSYGQTDDQDGFEKCLNAYNVRGNNNG